MFLDYFHFSTKCISRFNSSNEQVQEEDEIVKFESLDFFFFFPNGIDFLNVQDKRTKPLEQLELHNIDDKSHKTKEGKISVSGFVQMSQELEASAFIDGYLRKKTF